MWNFPNVPNDIFTEGCLLEDLCVYCTVKHKRVLRTPPGSFLLDCKQGNANTVYSFWQRLYIYNKKQKLYCFPPAEIPLLTQYYIVNHSYHSYVYIVHYPVNIFFVVGRG